MRKGPRPPRPGLRAAARPVGRIASDILSPAFRKRGFAQSALVDQWSLIAGEKLAKHTQPEKISQPRGKAKTAEGREAGHGQRSRFSRGGEDGGGVLTLRVDGPFAIEVQHMTPQLLERINSFFGYRAVGRIVLKQAPLPPRYERRVRKTRKLNPGEEQALSDGLQPIEDERLRAALLRLGRKVRGEAR